MHSDYLNMGNEGEGWDDDGGYNQFGESEQHTEKVEHLNRTRNFIIQLNLPMRKSASNVHRIWWNIKTPVST